MIQNSGPGRASIDQLHLATLDLTEGGGEEDLPLRIIRALRASKLTIGVAESCTGGLIAKRLTDPPGASTAFLGGVVAYANEVKVKVLGVAQQTIEQHGAVSAETASEMAVGARRVLGADIAVSVTGIAGPGGGSTEKPVGTVWIGIAMGTRVGARHWLLSGDRDAIRVQAAETALHLLWRLLTDAH